jgi:hypothetical protein
VSYSPATPFLSFLDSWFRPLLDSRATATPQFSFPLRRFADAAPIPLAPRMDPFWRYMCARNRPVLSTRRATVPSLADKTWEHESPSSFRETMRPSLGVGGGFFVKPSARRRLAVERCTCPKLGQFKSGLFGFTSDLFCTFLL